MIPDYQTLMRPVLALTADGFARVPDMLPQLQRRFGLSDEEMAQQLPKGRTTVIASNAHWARTYMAKAGLVRPVKRGHFEITQRGQHVLAQHSERVSNKILRGFPEFMEWLGRKTTDGDEPDATAQAATLSDSLATETSTPQQRIDEARRELEAALADDLLERLLNGSPRFFEHAVTRLLTAMGYGGGDAAAARVTGGSGDAGIDGVIDEDKLGLDRVYIQAKRYAAANTVGRQALQQFVGSLQGESASKGVFVTTSSFTADAVAYVKKVPQRVVLIDGRKFARLMIDYGVGVQAVSTFTLSEIDENFFNEESGL